MYKSSEVQALIAPSNEDELKNKEERIKKIIKSFNDHENLSIKICLLAFLGFFALSFIAYHSTIMISDYFNLNFRDTTFEVVTIPFALVASFFFLALIIFALVASFFFLALIIEIDYFQKSKNKVKKLFTELSDKPYQIRLESTGILSETYKVIVEENLVIENSHVIKDKSKHITGYVNLAKDRQSIVAFVHQLAQKSEDLFTKK